MYNSGEMYSTIKSGVISTVAAIGLAGLVAGCATPQKPLAPLASNTPNSVVLTNGERVCDIAGDWIAGYNVRGVVANDVVRVVRNDENFVGIKLIGDRDVGKGQQTIRGELKMNGFGKFQTYDSRYGWVNDRAGFNEDCSAATIHGSDYIITLKKKPI